MKLNKEKVPLKSIIRALGHRNFRLFFSGQSISLIGTWMQRVALGWLVYRLTSSPLLLGIVEFSSHIPAIIFSPVAGVLADKFSKHKLLIITQTIAMLQAVVLTILVMTDSILIWHFIALSLVLGTVNAFDMPIRQSFMVDMVDDKNDLSNAIALNSFMVNGAKLVGPSVAGILIAVVGEGGCFLLNALSYLAVLSSLFLMKIKKREIKPKKQNAMDHLIEGYSYAYKFEPIRDILLMSALTSIAGMPYIALMPIFARDILKVGSEGLGFLFAAVGIGAILGAYYLASKKSVLGLGKMIPIAAAIFGMGIIIFTISHNFVLSLFIMFITGFGHMVNNATGNTLIQTMVDDDKRGRIMSLYAIAHRGMTPIGSLAAGYFAGIIGAPLTLFIGGGICLLGALLFASRLPALRNQARPVYIKLGIIPDPAVSTVPEKLPGL